MTDISSPAPSVPPTDNEGTGGEPTAADSVAHSSGVDTSAAVDPVAAPVVEPLPVPDVFEPVAEVAEIDNYSVQFLSAPEHTGHSA